MDEKSKKLNTIISHYVSFHSPIIYKYTFCEVAFLMFKLCQAMGRRESSKYSKTVKFSDSNEENKKEEELEKLENKQRIHLQSIVSFSSKIGWHGLEQRIKLLKG